MSGETTATNGGSTDGSTAPRVRASALRTRICAMLGCEVPIVQTGMGWVSGSRLTAATCNAGGFGILASATMNYAELEEAIARVKERTDKPFGVNMRGDQQDIDERIALMIREGIRLASFAGAPPRAAVDKLKTAGILAMPTIGAKRHAEKMQEWGVDAVIAQGHEGGGHTGPVPTSILLPQVCAAVDIPVLGAGGFKDGRGLVAALAYGADGIAMGTRFLLTQESHVPDAVKQIYLKTNARGTVVTTAIDGHPQRVIQTALVQQLERSGPFARLVGSARNAMRFQKETGMGLMETLREAFAMKKSQDLSLAQLMMAANAPMLTRSSMVDGNVDAGILPTGQVAGRIDELPTVAEVLSQIVEEAEATLAGLGVSFGDRDAA